MNRIGIVSIYTLQEVRRDRLFWGLVPLIALRNCPYLLYERNQYSCRRVKPLTVHTLL